MANTKGRIRYLDYAKGLGIAFIVLFHTSENFPPLKAFAGYLSEFNVVLFFVIGGILTQSFREELAFPDFVRKKARTLLVPYVVFSVFNSAVKLIVLLIRRQFTAEVFRAEMAELLITGNGTVWFLPIYFVVSLAFYLLHRKNSRLLNLLVFAVSLILPYITTAYLNGRTIVLLNRLLSGLAYYIIGYYLSYLLSLTVMKVGYLLSIGIICFALGTLCYFWFGVPYSLFFWTGHFSDFTSSAPSSILISSGIILVSISIDKIIKRNLEILLWLGKNSLSIMLIHPTVLLCFTQTCKVFFKSLDGVRSGMVAVMLFLVIMVIDVPLVKLINKRFPWVLGKNR